MGGGARRVGSDTAGGRRAGLNGSPKHRYRLERPCGTVRRGTRGRPSNGKQRDELSQALQAAERRAEHLVQKQGQGGAAPQDSEARHDAWAKEWAKERDELAQALQVAESRAEHLVQKQGQDGTALRDSEARHEVWAKEWAKERDELAHALQAAERRAEQLAQEWNAERQTLVASLRSAESRYERSEQERARDRQQQDSQVSLVDAFTKSCRRKVVCGRRLTNPRGRLNPLAQSHCVTKRVTVRHRQRRRRARRRLGETSSMPICREQNSAFTRRRNRSARPWRPRSCSSVRWQLASLCRLPSAALSRPPLCTTPGTDILASDISCGKTYGAMVPTTGAKERRVQSAAKQ